MKLIWKRKLPALLLAAALVLPMSACAGKESPENSNTPEEPTPAAVETEKVEAPVQTLPEPEPTEEPQPEPTEEPQTDAAWAPEIAFSTLDSDGNEWTDAAFAEHKLTMVNLWAYWCGPCVGELPSLERLYETYAEQGLLLLGISDTAYEERNRSAAADAGVTYPCLRYRADFDPWMNTGYIPTTIFVDENGKVLGEAYVGSRSYEEWAAIVEDLLS